MRKLTAWFLMIVLCFSCALCVSEEASLEEMDIDASTLFPAAEDDVSREKKDSDGAYIMTITCTGDFTIGGDMNHKNIFAPELNKHDGDINFVMKNVRNILMEDDLTLVNFEGTLTDSTFKPKSKTKDDFIFSISPSYVSVLTDNGVEAVSLDNNHVRDHGEEGLAETKATLDAAGVIYSTPLDVGIFNYRNLCTIAMVSYNCIDRYGEGFKRDKFAGEYTYDFLQHDTFEEAVCDEIAQLKEIYPLVIVSFHWGKEPTKANPAQGYIPTENQIRLGHLAVDAGADLVIGTHSHRIQPIEKYNGKFICYSLANFCFAGNSKPSDMSSILFQIRYRVKENYLAYKDFRIIPIRISSTNERNDFVPTPLGDGPATDAVLNLLRSRENTKNLSDAVVDFPLNWN